MPLKLQYLSIRYLAEPARLILYYANESFEDERLTQETWEPIKASSPYNTVPILTVDGKHQIAQSMAIYHYLAQKYGLAGKGEIEVAKVEAVGEYFREMMNKILPYLLFLIGKNSEGTKESNYAKYFEPTVKQYLPVMIKLLKESKSEFFADSGATWVDFLVAEYIDSIHGHAPDVLKNYSELLEHSKRVHSLPQLQKYLQSRPTTPW
uniref:glutathione transferase n=1 Tax=Panagrolaimus superbus TaxID=310955 RepID=A0A914YB62_9BILA